MQVTASTPLWLAARTLLGLRRDDFFRHWRQAVATFDMEDIHDLRVASRRLREGLALFAPVYPKKSSAMLSKQVKQVTNCLGELRNTDESLLYFNRLGSKLGGEGQRALIPLIASLQTLRMEEAGRVTKALRLFRPGKLAARFQQTITVPLLFSMKSARDPLAPVIDFAREALTERHEMVMAILHEACREDAAAAQHKLRIAVKHLRYRLEIFAPLLGDSYETLHGVLKGYQEVLGKLHDMEVFLGLLAGLIDIPAAPREKLFAAMTNAKADIFARFMRLTELQPLAGIGASIRRVM